MRESRLSQNVEDAQTDDPGVQGSLDAGVGSWRNMCGCRRRPRMSRDNGCVMWKHSPTAGPGGAARSGAARRAQCQSARLKDSGPVTLRPSRNNNKWEVYVSSLSSSLQASVYTVCTLTNTAWKTHHYGRLGTARGGGEPAAQWRVVFRGPGSGYSPLWGQYVTGWETRGGKRANLQEDGLQLCDLWGRCKEMGKGRN